MDGPNDEKAGVRTYGEKCCTYSHHLTGALHLHEHGEFAEEEHSQQHSRRYGSIRENAPNSHHVLGLSWIQKAEWKDFQPVLGRICLCWMPRALSNLKPARIAKYRTEAQKAHGSKVAQSPRVFAGPKTAAYPHKVHAKIIPSFQAYFFSTSASGHINDTSGFEYSWIPGCLTFVLVVLGMCRHR